MELRSGIPVSAGCVQGFVFGGPFKKYVPGTRRLIGVKMAAEISHPHEVSIPTHDFSVPDAEDLTEGIIESLTCIKEGNDVYVGCMGGIGRTGLFMGVLSKALAEYNGEEEFDPVTYVRANYKGHAIETQEQMAFVRGFDVGPIVLHLIRLNEPQVVYVRPSMFETVMGWFGFR